MAKWDKKARKYVIGNIEKLEVDDELANGSASHTKSVNLASASSDPPKEPGEGRRSYQNQLSQLYPDGGQDDGEHLEIRTSPPSLSSLWGVGYEKQSDPVLGHNDRLYKQPQAGMDTVDEGSEGDASSRSRGRGDRELDIGRQSKSGRLRSNSDSDSADEKPARRSRRDSDSEYAAEKPARRRLNSMSTGESFCTSCQCTGEGGLCYLAHLKDGVGPMAKPRKCRDIVCIVFLVLCWIGMFIVFWLTTTEGCPDQCNDPKRLIFSTDSRTGEVCGTGSQEGRLRLYFPNPADPLSRRFCVGTCPRDIIDDARTSAFLGLYEGNSTDIETTRDNCFNPNSRHNRESPDYGCYYPTYPTVDILFKCVPVIPTNTTEAALSGLPQESLAYSITTRFISAPMGWVGSILAELQITWHVILGGRAVAVLLGFVWLMLLRTFALCLVVTFGLLFLLSCIAISLLAWDKAGVIGVANLSDDLERSIDTIKVSSGAAQVLATVFSVITGILLILAFCFTRRILVAVRLIQEAARTVIDIPSIMFFPCTTFISLTMLAIMSFVGGLYLASAGEFDPVLGSYSYASTFAMQGSDCAVQVLDSNPLKIDYSGSEHMYNISSAEAERFCVVYDGDGEKAIQGWRMSAQSRIATQDSINMTALSQGGRSMTVEDWLGGGFKEDLPFRASDYYAYVWLYHIFVTLWTYCFNTACLAMVIAGAVGHWYYREEGMPVDGFPVARSLLRLCCFQLGTAACAAFISALVWMARMVFQSIVKKIKVLKTVPMAGVAFCIVSCCIECVERFVKYINRNAVIVAAIHGQNFCWSATKAFSLILANILRVASVSMTSFFLLFMGQAFVTAAATLCVYAYLRFNPLDEEYNLNGTPVATLSVVALLSYVIARLFMGVYWMVIESVLLCFFDDCTKSHPLPETLAIEGRMTNKDILYDESGKPPRRPRRQRRV